MHKNTLSKECKNNDRATDTSDPNHARSFQKIERGRIAIFNGWILSMIGIVFYCFAMLSNETEADPFSSIFEHGLTGWAAIIFMVIGVGLWLKGSVTYLKESEQIDDSDKPTDSN